MSRLIGAPREVRVLASETVSLRVELGADVDPTGVVPKFLVTAPTVTDPGSSGWQLGSWNSGTYGNAGTSWTYAYTPLIGSAGVFTLTSGSRYRVWAWLPDLASENPMQLCGTIFCP